MTVTDDNLKAMGRMITPVGNTLRIDSSVRPRPRLKDGLYIVNKRQKWVLSIYRNVKTLQNDIEIAIDVHALVWPDESDGYRRALAWLELQRAELEHFPSGIHATTPPDSFRIGLKQEDTRSFLSQLHFQLFQTPPNQRWPKPADPPRTPSPQPAIDHMMRMAKQACAQSGDESVTIAKNKEWRFATDEAFRDYLGQLMLSGRCALSDLELDLTMVDADLAPSLDRIDSDGHYEPGNLQVVARFVNRWKSDDADKNFRRLLGLVGN